MRGLFSIPAARSPRSGRSSAPMSTVKAPAEIKRPTISHKERPAARPIATPPPTPAPASRPNNPMHVTSDHQVAVLENNSEVLLFISGVAKAIGVAATNGVINNSQTFGLAELEESITERDFPHLTKDEAYPLIRLSRNESLLDEGSLTRVLDAFQPYRLMQLLNELKNASQSQAKIDVYLGTACKPTAAISQIYAAYIKTRYDLRLHETPLMPYHLTPQLKTSPFNESSATLTTAFNITRSGEIVLAKRVIQTKEVAASQEVKPKSVGFFNKAVAANKDTAKENSLAVIEQTAKI